MTGWDAEELNLLLLHGEQHPASCSYRAASSVSKCIFQSELYKVSYKIGPPHSGERQNLNPTFTKQALREYLTRPILSAIKSALLGSIDFSSWFISSTSNALGLSASCR